MILQNKEKNNKLYVRKRHYPSYNQANLIEENKVCNNEEISQLSENEDLELYKNEKKNINSNENEDINLKKFPIYVQKNNINKNNNDKSKKFNKFRKSLKTQKLYIDRNLIRNLEKNDTEESNYKNLNKDSCININYENYESDNNNNEEDNKEQNYFKKNNNSKLITKILDLNNDEYNNQKNKYEEEINRLKQEISNLENDNDILSNQLKEEEKLNEELTIMKNEKEENDNSILIEIAECLQVNSFDEILPKLTEMINYLTKYNNDKSSKIKEDLISKLKSLYIITNNSKERKENITIQDLWRWIRQLVEEVEELSIEKEKKENYNRNNYEIYKNFCRELIKEFELNSFDELKFFINDLMTKNDINKKRVEKLKKVLMNSNEKEASFTSNNYNGEEKEYYNPMKHNNNKENKSINTNKKFNRNYFNDNDDYQINKIRLIFQI